MVIHIWPHLPCWEVMHHYIISALFDLKPIFNQLSPVEIQKSQSKS